VALSDLRSAVFQRRNVVPMIDAVTPSGGIQRWQSRGLDAVDRNLRAVYPNVLNLRLRDNEASYFGCFRLQLPELTLHRTLTSGYSCQAEPNDAVRLTFPVRGTVTVASSRSRIVASEGRTASVCVLECVQRDVAARYEGIHVQLTPSALLSRASILTGARYDLEEVSPSIDLRDLLGGTLLSKVVGLMREIERLDRVGLTALASASVNDRLMNLVVASVLVRARHDLSEPCVHPATNLVARARDIIRDRASGPINLGALAAELGVSLRAVQIGFRQQFGLSPSAYLRACRLELARVKLLAGHPYTTVTEVALECGFVNLGAFAGHYRRTFGELPSRTLAVSQRRHRP
jgi:AraC-like DNA-binding protein